MVQAFIIEYIVWVLLTLFVAIPAIVIFAVRGRISHWFNKDLKKYEQQLDLLKMQKHLQFSNVYTRRTEILAQIYANIVRIASADIILQSAKFKTQENLDIALKDYAAHIFDSQVYFSTNGIYLNESIRIKLGKLHNQVSKEILPYMSNVNEMIKENTLNEILNAPDINKDEILSELIAEFQEILGV